MKMAQGPKFRVQFRRRREGKTDYRNRLKLLLSEKPRLVIRKTNKRIIMQVVEYTPIGDKVLVSSESKELGGYGWKGGNSNLPVAYLTGLLCGRKAVKAGAKMAIVDLGLAKPVAGSCAFSAVKGALDAGMEIPHDPKTLPKEDRLMGEHIARYASLLGGDKNKRFSHYLNRGLDPSDLKKHFEEVKKNIEEGRQLSTG